MGLPEKLPVQSNVLHGLCSNSSRTPTRLLSTYFDSSVEGNVVTLGNGKTGVKQSKETEAKVQSDYLLTYTNTWGDHSLTATAGFTTYYNKAGDAGRRTYAGA